MEMILLILNDAVFLLLQVDDFAREKMDATMKELLEEKNDAMAACEDWQVSANL